MKKSQDTRAAILCEHIANKGYPILRAIRDEPLEEADSGWQFVCNSGEPENEDDAQVWAINEVLEIEPSLIGYLDSKPGTVVARENVNTSWKVKCNI